MQATFCDGSGGATGRGLWRLVLPTSRQDQVFNSSKFDGKMLETGRGTSRKVLKWVWLTKCLAFCKLIILGLGAKSSSSLPWLAPSLCKGIAVEEACSFSLSLTMVFFNFPLLETAISDFSVELR